MPVPKFIKDLAVRTAEDVARGAERQTAKRAARGAAKTGKELVADLWAKGLPEEARVVRPAQVKAEPRMEKRKKEQPKVANLAVSLSKRRAPEPKELSVFDLEGQPFVTSMSDLSAAGDDILAVNDVPLSVPVKRMGGQDYMFDAPGSVWAADLGNAGRHMAAARELRRDTGKDPVFLPWAMGPTAIDFAHMPREVMLQYAAEALGKRDRNRLTKDIRAVVPEFRELGDPASTEAFREAAGSQRAALNRLLDQYRERGGLGIGEARYATTDTEQLGLPLTSLRNVGVIDTSAGLAPSGHPSYRTSIPGEGVGRLKEPIGALDLLPGLLEGSGATGPFDFPVGVNPGVKSPLRALQMAPRGGIITDEILRQIEDRLAQKKATGGRVEAPDYDYDAARTAGVRPDKYGHLPDTYKLPNHMTFSDDSVYSTPEQQGGHWSRAADGKWVFWPSQYNMAQHPMRQMDSYFREVEQPHGNYAVYPSDFRLQPR